MKTNVGLWIDHRKALVVALTDKGEEIRLIIIEGGKAAPPLGGFPSCGSL
jgi:hypothetical protein